MTRRNKLTRLSATFLLLCRVLVAAVHKICKAASGGATRFRDRSVWFRKTLSHHRRGSRATHWRSNCYCPISIISPPFSLKFGLRHQQHPQRRRGSGRPPWCWQDTIGAWFSLLAAWDTMLVPGTPSSVMRSAKSFVRVHCRICLGN